MAADKHPLYCWIPPIVAVLYGVGYLYAIGDIDVIGPPAWGAFLGELTPERLIAARAPFRFEPVAMVEAGYVVLLISPLNLLLTILLTGLLAANIHGVMYLRAHPECRVGASGTFSAAAPALFAGGACCAPSLVLLLGIPGLGAAAAYAAWLVPLSILALGINRIWQQRQGAPRLARVF